MSLNSLPNSSSLRPSSFSDNFSLQSDKSSQSSLSGRETLSPLHNRTVAVDHSPVQVPRSTWNPLSWCSSSNTSGSQGAITVDKHEFTVPRPPKNIGSKVSFQSPLENDKLFDKAIEHCLQENHEEEQSTVSAFSRSDSLDNDVTSNDTVGENSNDVKTAPPEVSTLFPNTLADENSPALMNAIKVSKKESINNLTGMGINETFLTHPETKNFLSSNPPPIRLKEAVPSPLEHDQTLGQTLSTLFNEQEALPSSLEDDPTLGQAMRTLFNEKEAVPSLLEDDATIGTITGNLFDEQEAISASLKGSAAIESWFEKNADNLDRLNHSQTKELSQFEKKYPEELKNRLVNQLVEAYQSDKPEVADSQLKSIRQHLPPQLMASVDKSIIDTLNTTGKFTAAKLYQAKHVAMLPMHYEDVLKLDQLAKDLQAGRSLDRAGQEKLLSDAKAMLEKMDTQSFTPEQQAIMQAAKERVANLESALPLVDKSKVNKSDILKTLAGSAGLAACMAAIGSLISLLVKLGQSGAVDETESGEDAISDQTDTIEAKKSEIEDKQNTNAALKSQEKALLDKGANLTEDEISDRAESKAKEKVIANGQFVHDISYSTFTYS